MVYLIHFDQPFKHARHYVGFCQEKNLQKRLRYHRAGYGATLLKHVVNAGITFGVVRVWKNATRNFERQLKNQHHSARLCPACNTFAFRRMTGEGITT